MEQRTGFLDYAVSLLLFAFGLQLGIGFPDVDQRLPYFLHRSVLTHGILVPLALFLVLRKATHPAPRWFAMGFCIATTVHLCFDLFPRAWWGYALIWVPFYGRTTPTFSWLWIVLGCVVCLYLALLLVRHALEILVNVVGLGITLALSSAGERVGLALAFLFVVVGVAFALPSHAAALTKCMMKKS
jgi:hypothetical protein